MKIINHYGFYRHIYEVDSTNDMGTDLSRTSVTARRNSDNFGANPHDTLTANGQKKPITFE